MDSRPVCRQFWRACDCYTKFNYDDDDDLLKYVCVYIYIQQLFHVSCGHNWPKKGTRKGVA